MLPDDNAGGRDAGVQQGLEPLIPIGGKLQNAIVGREGYRERTKSELIWTQNQSLLNTMSHTLVIVLAVIGISSEPHTLWLIRQFGPQLTTPLRVALWIKLLSAVSLLISAGLLLITTRMESLLDRNFDCEHRRLGSLHFGVWDIAFGPPAQSNRQIRITLKPELHPCRPPFL